MVVDASVVAEVLLHTNRSPAAIEILSAEALVAPAHLPAEVTSVVRGWSLAARITSAEALRALDEYTQLRIQLVGLEDLLADAFALRHNLSAYDAFYVALARRLECGLLTFDTRLAAAAPDCAIVP